MTNDIKVGVIGGSGLYGMEGLEVIEERAIDTPFGAPSDRYVVGSLGGHPIAFLARHGRGHRISPSELNHRANVFGFKLLGVERLVSVSAVGSMKLEYRPAHIVIPDQLFDRTRHRPDTFFGDGLVAHVSMADPFCPELRSRCASAASSTGATVHDGGTYLCMEGPQFSTRAESEIYRSWGIDVIGMTNIPEAKLAREAEICYATLAMVTDYDCWHEEEAAVEVTAVLEVLRKNATAAQEIVRRVLVALASSERTCACGEALARALITDHAVVPADTLERLRPIVGRYFEN